MAETTASTLKELPTKSFTSTTNTWEGLQTFKDEVRIESSSDNGAIFRKFCDKLKVGETPSVGQSILIDQDCTKDLYVLHDRYVHVANNNDVSYAENIVPNLKYSSTEEREKHIFPIIRAVIDNSSNAVINLGSSKQENENLGNTWINLYGNMCIHVNPTKDDGSIDSRMYIKNDAATIESKGFVNCGDICHVTSDGYYLKDSYVGITEKESYTQYVERIYPNKKYETDEERLQHSNLILNAVVDNNGDATIHVGVGNGSDETTTSTTIFHGKAQCPTAPTADADLVNLSYLNSFGYTKGPKVKHLLWGNSKLGENVVGVIHQATAQTNWVNDFTGDTTTNSNHGVWSDKYGWDYNWYTEYISTEPYYMNVLKTYVHGQGGKITDYDAIACVIGLGDTYANPNIKVIPIWKMQMLNEVLSNYSDTSTYGRAYNARRCIPITTGVGHYFSIVVPYTLNNIENNIYIYYENLYLNSIWGLKF